MRSICSCLVMNHFLAISVNRELNLSYIWFFLNHFQLPSCLLSWYTKQRCSRQFSLLAYAVTFGFWMITRKFISTIYKLLRQLKIVKNISIWMKCTQNYVLIYNRIMYILKLQIQKGKKYFSVPWYCLEIVLYLAQTYGS